MKRRGFVPHEGLVVFALAAIAVAMIAAAAASIFHGLRDKGVSVPSAVLLPIAGATALLATLFGVIPALIAAPIAAFAKRSARRDERYQDLFCEYWSLSTSGVLVMFLLAGALAMVWKLLPLGRPSPG
jgi:hypothetical protein